MSTNIEYREQMKAGLKNFVLRIIQLYQALIENNGHSAKKRSAQIIDPSILIKVCM